MTPNLEALKEKIKKLDYIQILNNVGLFVFLWGRSVVFCYGRKKHITNKVRSNDVLRKKSATYTTDKW